MDEQPGPILSGEVAVTQVKACQTYGKPKRQCRRWSHEEFNDSAEGRQARDERLERERSLGAPSSRWFGPGLRLSPFFGSSECSLPDLLRYVLIMGDYLKLAGHVLRDRGSLSDPGHG